MADPFMGEIRIVGFDFAPRGWALCDGQLLLISQNTPLFAILGNTYGGDGQTTFALPDFRGRVPVNQGQGPGLTNRVLGSSGGERFVILEESEMPAHTHRANAVSGPGTSAGPVGNIWATVGQGSCPVYSPTETVDMSADALTDAGGDQPHNNQQPFLALNFIIALQGIFPSQGG